MRKDITLPILALAGGAVGFFLRRWQLTSAYQSDTGLFVRGAPATLALLGFVALLTVAFALLVQGKRENLDDFLPAFGSLSAGQMTILTAAGLILIAAGALGIQKGLSDYQVWRLYPDYCPITSPVSQLLTGALCIPGGLGILMMGRMAYRWELTDAGCILASFPGLMGVVWLFSSHLHWGSEPVLMKFGFRMAAICLLALAHYEIAAFLFGRPHPRRTAFFALMGVVLSLTALAELPGGSLSLADRLDRFNAAALAAGALSALGFAHALLEAPWPERMPPSREDDTDDDA